MPSIQQLMLAAVGYWLGVGGENSRMFLMFLPSERRLQFIALFNPVAKPSLPIEIVPESFLSFITD